MDTLDLPDDFNLLEKTLLDSLTQNHFVSRFYSNLQHRNPDRLSFLWKYGRKFYFYLNNGVFIWTLRVHT